MGHRLQELRNASGLTQEQVAEGAGIHRNHYQLLESGLSDRAKDSPANPRLSTLVALCRVLGTTVPDLIVELYGPPTGVAVEYETTQTAHQKPAPTRRSR